MPIVCGDQRATKGMQATPVRHEPQGVKGDTGAIGLSGPAGDQGAKGDDGSPNNSRTNPEPLDPRAPRACSALKVITERRDPWGPRVIWGCRTSWTTGAPDRLVPRAIRARRGRRTSRSSRSRRFGGETIAIGDVKVGSLFGCFI